MKRKLIAILTIFIVVLLSCRNDKKISDLRIEKSKDTLFAGEEIIVRIYLENLMESHWPAFSVITANDTARIPFDEKLKCGIFQGKFHKIGKREFSGFVEYYDKNGISRKEDFSFCFLVK